MKGEKEIKSFLKWKNKSWFFDTSVISGVTQIYNYTITKYMFIWKLLFSKL